MQNDDNDNENSDNEIENDNGDSYDDIISGNSSDDKLSEEEEKDLPKLSLSPNQQIIGNIPNPSQTVPDPQSLSSKNNNNENNQSNLSILSGTSLNIKRVKPKYYKLLSEILNKNFTPILNYLDLKDLCSLRIINHMLLNIIHKYYPERIQFEIDIIIAYQEKNKENTQIFMKNIDSQIPISNKNWLDFDLSSVTQKLKLMDRNLIAKLRSIKSIGKLNECIYAPFCIIFNQYKYNFGYGNNNTYNINSNNISNSQPLNNINIKNESWKQKANKILSDPNFIMKVSELDLENLNDKDILNAFVFLNLNELDLHVIKKSSSDLTKLIIWCQAVVSYHILIHPYIYRNEKSIVKYGENVLEFAKTINKMINRFYKFKRFLYNLNIKKIPLADYVFNLQHSREVPVKQENIAKDLTESNISNILSYLSYIDSYKYMFLSKKFYNGFKASIDLEVFEILKEIYFVKRQAYDKIINIIPIIYQNNIFSNYFIMLDDILHSQCFELGLTFIPFLTKEQLNDLKKIKIKNDNVIKIAKIFCIICDIKPERKANAKGEIELFWLEKIKILVINNKILKIMRNVNQLSFNENKLKMLHKELSIYYNRKKIEEIKKINHGIYQLLIWELFVYEYIQVYNPFDFINQDYINHRYNQEQVDLIKYYIEILNFLKYHLKVKFHFSHNENSNLNASFNFYKIIQDLKNYLSFFNIGNNIEEKDNTNIKNGGGDNIIENDVVFHCTEPKLSKIANVYFESKNLIPVGAKPALFEKILIEILAVKEKKIFGALNVCNNSGNMDTMNQMSSIKEEEKENYKSSLMNNINNTINMNLNNNKNLQKIKNDSDHVNTFSSQESNILLSSNKTDSNNVNTNNINSLNNAINVKLNNQNNINNLNSLNLDILSKNEKVPTLFSLPDNIIIKNILVYLDINSLPKFALSCHKGNECIKTHIFLRLFFINREKKIIEEKNKILIKTIESKRSKFFKEYEIERPNKNHSYEYMNRLSIDDIMELKQCYKKYNKNYEAYIEPLMILFGEKSLCTIKPDGTKVESYYPIAKKILFSSGFTKRIKEIELETIDNNIFQNVERIIEGENFNENKIKILSPCLQNLIFWIKGIIEFHRVIRKFSLSYYDYEILNEEEINFCVEMDNIFLLYYKLMRYENKYCKKYEEKSKKIMMNMGI